MTFELRLHQQMKNWQEISLLKEKIKKLIADRQKAEAIVRSCGQKIPKLQEEMFKKMDTYDKTW